MRRTLLVARFELLTALRSRAFFLAVLLVPGFLAAAIALELFAHEHASRAEYAVGVLDRTGVVYEALAQAAQAEVSPRYRIEDVSADSDPKKLAQRVLRGELFAWIEIPEDVLVPGSSREIAYYAASPTQNEPRRFVTGAVSRAVIRRRLWEASIDPAELARLEQPVGLRSLQIGREGKPRPLDLADELGGLLLPAGLMFLLFLVAMTTSARLLSAVVEEKSSRIAEVLLGAVRPFELMAGKLLATAALSLLVGAAYLGAQSEVGQLPDLYVEAAIPGATATDAPKIRLVGKVSVDANGQITTSFHNNPQLRFSQLQLTFPDGPHALFVTPRTCGTPSASSLVTSRNICGAIATLRSTPATAHLPVIAFAPEDAPQSLAAALKAGANIAVNETAVTNYLPQLIDQALQID